MRVARAVLLHAPAPAGHSFIRIDFESLFATGEEPDD
jgi:hypothetical protein